MKISKDMMPMKIVERRYKGYLMKIEVVEHGMAYQLERAYIIRPVDRTQILFPHQQSTERTYFSIESIESEYFLQMRVTIDSLVDGQSFKVGGDKIKANLTL